MGDDSSLRSLIAPTGFVPQDTVDEVLGRQGSEESLLLRLLPLAAQHSIAPISKFKVGAVVLGSCDAGGPGAIYLGANCEFSGMSLATSIHAEQSAVSNAWLHGERRLRMIAVTSTPCGHCRQFLSELAEADILEILVPENHSGENHSCTKHSLQELFPLPFGPAMLGITSRFLEPTRHRVTVDSSDPLTLCAAEAAGSSYAPYTGNLSGVALQLADGSTVCGRIAENAAFNPTLSPMACAIASLSLRSVASISDIRDAVLVEVPTTTSQRQESDVVLHSATGRDLPLRYVVGRLT